MRRFAAIAGICGALAGCSSSPATATAVDGGGGDTNGAMKASMPSAASEAVLTSIASYASWAKFPENPTPAPSQAHMGMWVLAYHDDAVTQAMTSHALPLPDGATIVKENYVHPTDAMPMSLTVMQKRGGSWYWVEATGDRNMVIGDPMSGVPLEGANVPMCIGCHSKASANDFVLTHLFAPPDAGPSDASTSGG